MEVRDPSKYKPINSSTYKLKTDSYTKGRQVLAKNRNYFLSLSPLVS